MKMDVPELMTELNVYLQKYSVEEFTATYDSTSNEMAVKKKADALDSISSYERVQAQNLINETREFQNNIELAIKEGIDNDFMELLVLKFLLANTILPTLIFSKIAMVRED